MFTCTDPPATSAPVLAATNFTVCIPLLPATQTRPSEETVSGLEPPAKFVPTQPLKLFRRDGASSAYPVRKPVAGGPLHWKFAVTVSGPDSVTIGGFALPLKPPLQFTKV